MCVVVCDSSNTQCVCVLFIVCISEVSDSVLVALDSVYDLVVVSRVLVAACCVETF